MLDPSPDPRRIRDLSKHVERLRSHDESVRLISILARRDRIDTGETGEGENALTAVDDVVREGNRRLTPLQLEAVRRAGIAPDRLPAILQTLCSTGELVSIDAAGRRLTLPRRRLIELCRAVLKTVGGELDRRHPRRSLPRKLLQQACRDIAAPDVIEAVFTHLIESKQLVETGENIGPAERQVRLTNRQQAARKHSLERIATLGLMPPTLKELAAELGMPAPELAALLDLCVEDGLLIRIDESLCFTPESLENGRSIVAAALRDGREATMSQLREAWGVTRKYSLPLCAWFDGLGITRRDGDLRRAGPFLNTHQGNESVGEFT